MLTPFELEQKLGQQARERVLKAAQPPTPGHSAAAAANQYAGDVGENADAQRRRSRVQHEPEPYAGDDDDVACVVEPEVDKRFRQAYDNDAAGYPPMTPPPAADMFRRRPITADQEAYGPGYAGFAADAYPVPVPPATLSASAICRPLITSGQSRPCAPGGE